MARYTRSRAGTWRSLVAPPGGGRKVAGSNQDALTDKVLDDHLLGPRPDVSSMNRSEIMRGRGMPNLVIEVNNLRKTFPSKGGPVEAVKGGRAHGRSRQDLWLLGA